MYSRSQFKGFGMLGDFARGLRRSDDDGRSRADSVVQGNWQFSAGDFAQGCLQLFCGVLLWRSRLRGDADFPGALAIVKEGR